MADDFNFRGIVPNIIGYASGDVNFFMQQVFLSWHSGEDIALN